MDNVISLDDRRPSDSNPDGYPVLRPRAVLPDPSEIIGNYAAVDTETTGLHVDDGATTAVISVAYRRKSAPAVIESYAFPFDQGRAEDKGFEIQRYKDGRPKADVDLAKWQIDVNLPESDWTDMMEWLGQVPFHIGQNYKFDLHHQRNGTRHFSGRDFRHHFMWDTQLTNRHLWPTESTSLKPTGERLWGPEAVAEAEVLRQGLIDCKKLYGLRAEHGPRYDLLPWDINGPYAAKDTVLTLQLAEYQWVTVFEEGQGLVGEIDQQFDLSRVLYRMERRGIGPFDKDRADRIARFLEWRIEELEATFPFQPPTAARARKHFYEDLGLAPWKGAEKPHVVNRNTGKVEQQGTLTTAVAKRLAAADVPHAADYAEYLRLKTANQMNYRGYHDLCGRDGQLRTSFRQGFVKSGRMALTVDTRVLTPAGWRKMGSLQVGDDVIGSDGQPTRIVAVPFFGGAKTYRVRTSDGTEVECSDSHLWSVRHHGGRNPHRFRAVTAEELYRRVKRGRAFHLPDLQPVRFAETDLPIDPYVLGVLLGNGSLEKTPRFSVFEEDTDVAWRVAERVPDEVRRHADRIDRSVRFGFVGRQTGKILGEIGLLGRTAVDKFVPVEYLTGSIEQRVELLRGLMDTDGFVDKRGGTRFDTASEQLALAVRELVLSLGGVASIKTRGRSGNSGPGPYYVVHLSARECPFAGERKSARWRRPTRFPRRIVSVEVEDRQQMMKCISVAAEDHLFVTEGYVLTHNSVERFQAQALPKHLGLEVAGRKIPEPRDLFGVREGNVRVNLDLSQAEMRIAAKFSNCQTMIDLLESGGDMHGNTTRSVFNRDTDDPEWAFYRDIGKRLNFASIFLVGPKTFQETLWTEAEVDWPLSQCKSAVYGWRRTYPEFEKEYAYWMQFAEVNGYVELVGGRKSWLTTRDWPRTGWNRRVQSSLAVFVADWLIEIERRTEQWDALELMVHDSAILQLPEDKAEEVVEDIKEMTAKMWFNMFQISGGCDVSAFSK